MPTTNARVQLSTVMTLNYTHLTVGGSKVVQIYKTSCFKNPVSAAKSLMISFEMNILNLTDNEPKQMRILLMR